MKILAVQFVLNRFGKFSLQDKPNRRLVRLRIGAVDQQRKSLFSSTVNQCHIHIINVLVGDMVRNIARLFPGERMMIHE